MSIVKGYTLPHPPLAIPQVGGKNTSKNAHGDEDGGANIAKTLAAFKKAALDIAAIAPETIIFITPHGTAYSDYFHISPGFGAAGDFGRFGAQSARLETYFDEELILRIEDVSAASGIPAGTQGQKNKELDHGVMVPMWFINEQYTNYKSVCISQSGMSAAEHYMLGQAVSKAVEMTGRKTVIVASSDLSHKLTSDGPYGYAPEGAEFDKAVVDTLTKGDFLSFLQIDEKIKEKAGECGYNSLAVLAGCFDLLGVKAEFLSYEAPFGVGYAVMSFESTGTQSTANRLERYLKFKVRESEEKRNTEDGYQKLARESLEHMIETGEKLPIPNGLPSEMTGKKAGVFVSLHKNGRLRGCIGTIAPSTDSIAEEIIQNAVSAGLSDTRFSPVASEELQFLSYKVDVLSDPEDIEGMEQLDVKKYGVIVTSGYKRGLLLPNLDGVDTTMQQIEIAKNKAGITEDEKVKLQRFEVIRHG
ncbi:MAG: AmmeMemoRadiSam system protein A [Oscillospiraceae bacterium]|nr:AmmeMemoRadiSam system protein A [Oscillospiraceae bacterium]